MHTKRVSINLVFLVFVTLPIVTIAQDASLTNTQNNCIQTLSLEEFRAYALQNSSLVAEIDRDYAHELATAFEAETLANPELQAEQTFTNMNLAGADDPQTQISLGQPIRISNLGSRRKVAQIIQKVGDIEQKIKLLKLLQNITFKYESLATYQQIESKIIDAETRATNKLSLIKEGVKKGLLSKGDRYLFEGEKYRLKAQAQNVASLISTLRADLSKETNFPCQIKATSIPTLDPLPPESVLIDKAENNPISESTKISLLENLSEAQLKMAELDSYPELTPRLIYQHTNDGGDFFGAGISVQLPLFNQNQAAQTRAVAEKSLQKKRRVFFLNGGLGIYIKALRQAIVSSEEQANLFTKKVIPAFEKAFKSQEYLYAQGKGNVLQVWQTLKTLNEVQTQGLQLSLEAKARRIQLSMLIGEEI
jgi:outer membrane protein TolC